jgi:hypothetical protein
MFLEERIIFLSTSDERSDTHIHDNLLDTREGHDVLLELFFEERENSRCIVFVK